MVPSDPLFPSFAEVNLLFDKSHRSPKSPDFGVKKGSLLTTISLKMVSQLSLFSAAAFSRKWFVFER